MRFKTFLPDESKHSELVSGVGWYSNEEIYSCGDDHVLLKWNLVKNTTDKVLELPPEFYPTDLQWYPGQATSGGIAISSGSSSNIRQGADVLLITSTDGKFHFINKHGRIEKSVEAHKGAVLCGCWSYDGMHFLTAGEDGQVKIWTRSGLPRSTLMQSATPVYSAVWSPNCSQVLHTMGKHLVVRTLANTKKYYQWAAHEGLILKVSWHPINDLIISGGEDCRYKVWDPYGRQLYCSSIQEYPITSLAWCPSGDLFAVGSFNALRLCDKRGWSHSLEKPHTGSVFNLAWSIDGTQVAGACGNGHVVVAHVIERRLEWDCYTATMVSRDTIAIRNVTNDARETLDFSDRIVKLEFGFGHLVVATPTQCHIFSIKNWNTPIIFNLRDGSVSIIVLGDRHFLMVEKSSTGLYSYDGKLLCLPRWPVMHLDTLSPSCVSISPDTIAVRDQVDLTVVHLFEINTSRNLTSLPQFKHKENVMVVALNQVGNAKERLLAILDKGDLVHIYMVRGNVAHPVQRIGRIIYSLCWNTSLNMLAAIQENDLSIWPCPVLVFHDRELFEKTAVKKQITECGARVVSFDGGYVGIRRVDGSLVSIPVSPYIPIFLELVSGAKLKEALQLCHTAKDTSMWACLAGMALNAKDLDTALDAYVALREFVTVDKILEVQKITVPAIKVAQILMLNKNSKEAETLLLQNGFVFRAIMTNIDVCDWDRALDLAVRNKTHVDTVLLKRKQYLEGLKMEEDKPEYLKFKDEVELDPEKIEEKIELEYAKELGEG
ncbi:intraflagellar transport protein 80 homolog [Anabrus simplex]|uniref:intraflagellar transport protein 80 homolog n=1 Tax=Anabrus simplex TaxID=316456 RepID=UPI0035A27556